MRYFRFQGESKVAAVLFGVLEEANLPQSKRLRKRLNELKYASGGEETDRKLLEFVLDDLVSQETLLSVWNYEYQFYIHLKRLFQDSFASANSNNEELLESLQRKLDFELVNSRELSSLHPKAISIVCSEAENEAVLLYRHYAVSSIVITPCGHPYIKWRLFAEMRQIMGKPETIEEFSRKGWKCRCGTENTDIVFEKGSTEARPLAQETAIAVYNDILSEEIGLHKYSGTTSSGRCRWLGHNSDLSLCPNGHSLCTTCLANYISTRHQFRCLQCHTKVQSDVKDRIIRETSDPVTVMCEGCRIEAPIGEFTESWNSSHGCLICRDCRETSWGLCPSCGEVIARSIAPLKTAIPPSSGLKCASCRIGKPIQDFSTYLRNVHGCLICNQCIHMNSQYQTRICPKCLEAYSFTEGLDTAEIAEMMIRCQDCIAEKAVSEYSQASKLSHWFRCRVCDTCLLIKLSTRPSTYCSNCKDEYTREDTDILNSLRPAVPLELQYSKSDEQIPRKNLLCCAKCSTQHEISHFSVSVQLNHQCLVCDTCFLAHQREARFIVGPLQKCPKCLLDFNSSESSMITEALATLSPPGDFRCGKCWQSKSRFEMEKWLALEHECQVCDKCISSLPTFPLCLACQKSYSSSDLAKLGRVSQQKVCRCGGPILDGAYLRCPSLCTCSVCLAKHYLFTNQLQCPGCDRLFSGDLRRPPSCSNCHRQLKSVSYEVVQAVCGVCEDQHVLCCFCASSVHPIRGKDICRASVRLREGIDLERIKREFTLGCFCGQISSRTLSKLTCGHDIHYTCTQDVYFCRICLRNVKDAPRIKLLGDCVE